jgi:hypothetical protein
MSKWIEKLSPRLRAELLRRVSKPYENVDLDDFHVLQKGLTLSNCDPVLIAFMIEQFGNAYILDLMAERTGLSVEYWRNELSSRYFEPDNL